MKKNLSVLLSLIMLGWFICSCDKDNGPKEETAKELQIAFKMPANDTHTLENIMLTMENIDTGEKIVIENLKSNEKATVKLAFGQYNIVAEGNHDTHQYTAKIGPIAISKESDGEMEIALIHTLISNSFVIKEMFYSGGTNNANKKSYQFAHYVILHNNSKQTLYADSIVFVGTASNTKIKTDNYRSYLPNKVVADFAFMIPGKGKDHPVKPGEDLVICMEAKNHQEIASNVPNLAKKAHFEWFEPNEYYQLTDNPNVPNMEILFKTSLSITSLHSRGYQSYFIFKLPKSKEKLFEENAADFKFPNPKVPPIKRPVIPAEWILDGVELFDKTDGITKALPTSIDKSYTFCSEAGKGYTIQRKTNKDAHGRTFYIDTNDSANDFEKDRPSSIL